MKYNVITIGGNTEDIMVVTDEGKVINNKGNLLVEKLLAFEQGAKFRVPETYSTFGGGAANAAVNFAGLGLRTAIITCLGDDGRGMAIKHNLKEKGVKLNLVQTAKGKNSGFSFVIIDQTKERTIFTHRGANNNLKFTNNEIKNVKKTDWLYISSLSNNWKKLLKSIFLHCCKFQKAKIAWNPGRAQLEAGFNVIGKYIKDTAVFCVNKDEALELVLSHKEYKNKRYAYLRNVKNLLRIIKSWGPDYVVITSGKKGADVYDGDRIYHRDIMKEKIRLDATGLGDAFNSSFVAGLHVYKGDIDKAIHLGLRATASVIAKPGGQNGLLSRGDI
jgi:ribokinase